MNGMTEQCRHDDEDTKHKPENVSYRGKVFILNPDTNNLISTYAVLQKESLFVIPVPSSSRLTLTHLPHLSRCNMLERH
jgi:hypothetical protein